MVETKQIPVSLTVLGGASTVTGSKHLLEVGGRKVLLDCGLFQGIKALRLKNRAPLAVDAKSIDCVLLSHAHLDHCGYIPLLVKQGFTGRILMTPPTRDLAELILRDAAKIQEEDARRANEQGFSKHRPALPLFDTADVERALPFFEVLPADQWTDLLPHLSFRFVKNGHILGSACIDLRAAGRRIVFSGDLGRNVSALLNTPDPLSEADVLLLESTYGDRPHPETEARMSLAEVIRETLRHRGDLIIPSFAVGRAQELMFIINGLKASRLIPSVPVYLDSPMAAGASELLRRHVGWHKLKDSACEEVFRGVSIVRSIAETHRIVNSRGSKIVIAASGMLEGGRVLEYLKKALGHRRDTILLSGYQAEGTRGRALKEHAHELKIHGRYYPVKANIREITSLSAHADQPELIQWIRGFHPSPKKIILVHGEPHALDAFRVKIKSDLNSEACIAREGETIVL